MGSGRKEKRGKTSLGLHREGSLRPPTPNPHIQENLIVNPEGLQTALPLTGGERGLIWQGGVFGPTRPSIATHRPHLGRSLLTGWVALEGPLGEQVDGDLGAGSLSLRQGGLGREQQG